MISMDKSGGRTIHLFIPFEHNGKRIESITLSPIMLGHTLRWGAGDWQQSIDMLVEVAGVEDAVIRSLRYPDANRVMESFLSMLPPDIRDDIANGRIPEKRTTPEEALERVKQGLADVTAQTQALTNGGGGAAPDAPQNFQGPGVPLPEAETGFDLSDEP